MTLAAALLTPLMMLALVFCLARIEDRHLTARPRVADRVAAEPDGPAAGA